MKTLLSPLETSTEVPPLPAVEHTERCLGDFRGANRSGAVGWTAFWNEVYTICAECSARQLANAEVTEQAVSVSITTLLVAQPDGCVIATSLTTEDSKR